MEGLSNRFGSISITYCRDSLCLYRAGRIFKADSNICAIYKGAERELLNGSLSCYQNVLSLFWRKCEAVEEAVFELKILGGIRDWIIFCKNLQYHMEKCVSFSENIC